MRTDSVIRKSRNARVVISILRMTSDSADTGQITARPTPREYFCSQMPPTALGRDAEDASYTARADTLGSVARQLAARRIPADRFPDGVPAQGESPAPRTRSTWIVSAKRKVGCWPRR